MSAADCEQQGTGWGILGRSPRRSDDLGADLQRTRRFRPVLGAFVGRPGDQPVRVRFGAGRARCEPRRSEHNRAGDQRLGGARGGRPDGVRSENRPRRRWLADRDRRSAARSSRSSSSNMPKRSVAAMASRPAPFFTLYFLLTGFHLLHVVPRHHHPCGGLRRAGCRASRPGRRSGTWSIWSGS